MFITTSGLNPHDSYICHYGVKGMKWGVRKDRSSGNTSEARRKQLEKQMELLAEGVNNPV